MSDTIPHRPIPRPTADSQPFWDGLHEGKYLLQSCAACGKVRHYPCSVCPHCYSMKVVWVESTRQASLHSWTIAHHAFHPHFREQVPYVIGLADLEEGVRVNAVLHGCAPEELHIGMSLRLEIECVEDGLALPRLVPTSPQAER